MFQQEYINTWKERFYWSI